MKRISEIILIYAAGLIQGLVLVSVPAASSVFTDPGAFGFSDSQYGGLFIPQVIMAIAGALMGPRVAARCGLKNVFQAGLFFNAMAMGFISLSEVFAGYSGVYYLVMLGTTSIGAAFGTTLPMINVYAERLFPDNSAPAITGLHTLLGAGTALAPLLVSVLVRGIGWAVMPVGTCISAMVLFVWSFFLPLKGEKGTATGENEPSATKKTFPLAAWLFVIVVFLYGYCETIFANWAIIFLKNERGIPREYAGYALAAFWAGVTIGRLIFSFVTVWIPPRVVYRVLPALIAFSLWAVTLSDGAASAIGLFALAGIACSAFFPLSFSFAQSQFASMAETVSGSLMASYMLGYGLASYGIGSVVEKTDIAIGQLYQTSIVFALGVLGLSFFVSRQRPEGAT